MKEAKEATRRSVEAGAKVVKEVERGVDEESEALITWVAWHGVDVDDLSDVQLFLWMEESDMSSTELRRHIGYDSK